MEQHGDDSSMVQVSDSLKIPLLYSVSGTVWDMLARTWVSLQRSCLFLSFHLPDQILV